MPAKRTPPTRPTITDPKSQASAGAAGKFSEPTAAALGAAGPSAEDQAVDAGLEPDLISLRDVISRKLAEDAKTATAESTVQSIDGSNIVGVGFGYARPGSASSRARGRAPGQMGLTVFTREPAELSAVEEEIGAIAGTRALSSVPLTVDTVGIVQASPHQFRLRPAPGGISVGHFAITFGTLGCLAIRDDRLLILSNNHVLANENNANIGDPIVQPGPTNGGTLPNDLIALLERFVPINFNGGVNLVDCATGWAYPERVRPEILYLDNGAVNFFEIADTPKEPFVNMMVGKSGARTQLTQGYVNNIGVAVNVTYNTGVAHFEDQMSIVGAGGGLFSDKGDSGSIVWHWGGQYEPVGLFFADGGGTSFANRITRVIYALDIQLHTHQT